jgi:O-antigen/teichoic acid export membrane protein
MIDKIIKGFNLPHSTERIVKNVYWALIGKCVSIFTSFIVGVFVARYLGPEQYGLMTYVISYVMLFSILTTFGLDSIEVRELAKGKISKDIILGTAIAIRLSLVVVTLLLIVITLLIFEPDAFTIAVVLIYSVSLFFVSLNVIRNYFTSIVQNEYIVKTEISRTLIGAAIKILLLINHASLLWFIIANTFDFMLIGSGFIYAYRKQVGNIYRSWRFEKDTAELLLKESFPLLLSGIAIIIYQRIDQIMIKSMIGYNAVGQFSIASGLIEYAIFIPIVIAQTITPILVQLHQKNIDIYNLRKQQFVDLMVWSSVLLALFLSLTARSIILLLYGDKFSNAIPVLQIMSWKLVFVSLFASSGQLIIIENIQRYAAVRNILGCVVCIILNLFLIPVWGIIGSAVASLATISFSGYFSHLVILPYRHLFQLQTSAMFSGIQRLIKSRFTGIYESC